MFNIRFNLNVPWSTRFESLWSKTGSLPIKNKHWELQLMKTTDIISFDFRVSSHTDHAGIDLWLGFLGLSFNAVVYDSRHWNYEFNTWEKPDAKL